MWNDALATHFFGERFSHLPILFFVDEDVLAALHPSRDREQTTHSLAAAVQAKLCPPDPHGVFDAIERGGRKWKVRGADGVPPFLHLLALCVLAASRMGTGKVAPTNYRHHLATLLDLPDDEMPAGFRESLYIMWEWFRWWLDDFHAGEIGLCTVAPDPHRSHIGLPLSQTLFRTADAARLDDFFRWIDLEPGEPMDEDALLAYFRVWAPGRDLSDGALRMLGNKDLAATIQRILIGYARNWDGTRSDRVGPRTSPLRLVVTAFPRVAISAQAIQPDGYSARLTGRLADETVVAEANGGVYDLSRDVDDRILSSGLRVSDGDCGLVLEGSPVHVLRLDEDLGGWASVEALAPGERHWLLVSPLEAGDVLRQLKRTGTTDFTYQPGPGRVSDWMLIRNVVVDDPQGLRGALSARRPTERHRLAFRGGLPLAASNAYLAGGAPDLWLPAPPSATTPVQVDSGEVSAGSEVVALSELIDASDASEHRIEYGGVVRRFHTVASALQMPPRVAVPVHVLAVDETGGVSSHRSGAAADSIAAGDNRVTVVGARVRGRNLGGGPQPVLLRRGAQSAWLLGSKPGDLLEIRAPRPPEWLKRAHLSDRLYEARAEFAAVWVVEGWRSDPKLRIRLARADAVVSESDAAREQIEVWGGLLREATLLKSAPQHEALLAAYRSEALTASKRCEKLA